MPGIKNNKLNDNNIFLSIEEKVKLLENLKKDLEETMLKKRLDIEKKY